MIFQLDGLRFACFGGRRTEKCLFMPLKTMCKPRVCNSQGAIALKTSVHVDEKDHVFMFPHVWMYFIQNEWRAQHARLLLQPLHFYPNSASTLLPWALTSQPLTHRCTYCTCDCACRDLHPPAAARPSWPWPHLHTHLHVLAWLHPTEPWLQRLSYHQCLPAENISSYV